MKKDYIHPNGELDFKLIEQEILAVAPAPKPNRVAVAAIFVIIGIIAFSIIGTALRKRNADHPDKSSAAITTDKPKPQASTKHEKERIMAELRAAEERKRLAREQSRRNQRNQWRQYISISPGDYRYNALLGGIYDLDIAINNNLPYTIDEIIISVDYIKANGSLYKTEFVTFNGIAANYSMRRSAPDSERGVKVDNIKIQKVYSGALELCYDLNNASSSSDDPYKCK